MSQDAIDRLRQIAVGFQQAKILLAAAQLRVFERLRAPRSAGGLAGEIGADARALEILLDALVAMGVLEKSDGVYRNVAALEPLLVEDAPSHYVASLRHQNRLFRHWAFLEERVLGEKAPAGIDRASEASDHEDFIRAMYAITHRQADQIVARIDVEGVRTMADLGGGPGHYLVALLRRVPEATPFLVDLAPTLAVAARVQAANPAWTRVRAVEWDLYADPPPACLPPLDLAFLSQVVHSESDEANRAFFARLFTVVAPGGRVIVHERTVDPDRTSPVEPAIFAVNMLVMTRGGRSYTEAEIVAWGRAAGFVEAGSGRVSERSHLIVLRKTA